MWVGCGWGRRGRRGAGAGLMLHNARRAAVCYFVTVMRVPESVPKDTITMQQETSNDNTHCCHRGLFGLFVLKHFLSKRAINVHPSIHSSVTFNAQPTIQDSRLLYYLIREIKTWLNINHNTDESHFNVSLTVRGKVTKQRPQTTTFEERGEPKRNRTGVLLLTCLKPYR